MADAEGTGGCVVLIVVALLVGGFVKHCTGGKIPPPQPKCNYTITEQNEAKDVVDNLAKNRFCICKYKKETKWFTLYHNRLFEFSEFDDRDWKIESICVADVDVKNSYQYKGKFSLLSQGAYVKEYNVQSEKWERDYRKLEFGQIGFSTEFQFNKQNGNWSLPNLSFSKPNISCEELLSGKSLAKYIKAEPSPTPIPSPSPSPSEDKDVEVNNPEPTPTPIPLQAEAEREGNAYMRRILSGSCKASSYYLKEVESNGDFIVYEIRDKKDISWQVVIERELTAADIDNDEWQGFIIIGDSGSGKARYRRSQPCSEDQADNVSPCSGRKYEWGKFIPQVPFSHYNGWRIRWVKEKHRWQEPSDYKPVTCDEVTSLLGSL
jgi:hypothetical protein